MKRVALVLALSVAGWAGSAEAGWNSLGAMPAPQREGDSLVFKSAQGIVSVGAVAPDIVRVRFSPTAAFGRDHSYAVVGRDLGAPGATIRTGAAESTIATSALRVTIRHDPFRISVADAAGNLLDQDDPERGIAVAGKEVKVWKTLRPEELVYGLG
jgi:alpha-glucosidase